MLPAKIENIVRQVEKLRVENTDKTRYKFDFNTNTLYIPISETDFDGMFQNCNILEEISLCIDNKIEQVACMFNSCYNLKHINFIKKLNLEKVYRISRLFYGCMSLEEIDLSNIIVSDKLKDIAYMFYGCTSLKEIDFRNILFNSQNIKSIQYLCCGCTSLKEINFGNNFNTENITSACNLFSDCYNLKNIIWKDYQCFKNIINTYHMFNGCKKLKEVDLRGIDFNNISSIQDTFNKTNPELKVLIDKKFKNYISD